MTVILHKKLKSWWQVTRTPSETIFMQVEKKHARTAGNLHQHRQWRRSAFLEHRAIFEVKTEGCATIPILEKVSCGGLVTREQRLLSWQAIPRSQPFHAGGRSAAAAAGRAEATEVTALANSKAKSCSAGQTSWQSRAVAQVELAAPCRGPPDHIAS